jgi:hypothetical protein
MSNPDSSVVGNLSAISILATLAAICISFLFIFKDKSYFNYLLYGGLPILIYLLASIINILAQQLSSKSINVGRAFLGGLPTLGTVYLSLLLSYVSYARIPIVSAIAPLFLKTSVDVVANPIERLPPSIARATTPATTPATWNGPGSNEKPSKYPVHNTITRNNSFVNIKKPHGGMQPSKKSKKYVGGECCGPTMTLENIENKNPFIMGLSYGFYMFFAVCFGGIIGTRIALT